MTSTDERAPAPERGAAVPDRSSSLARWLPRTTGLETDDWRSRHRIVTVVLAAHLPVLGLFGLLQDVPREHLLGELVLIATTLVLARALANRASRAIAASVGLMICSAVLVHLSNGNVEAHFHYFVALTLVALYQEWRVYAAAIVFVLVQHGVFSVLDPDVVFDHPGGTAWGWSLVHTFAVAALTGVILLFWQTNERTQALRLRAEAARLGDQRRVAQMVAESPVGISRQSLDGRVLEVNPALVRMLGRPAHALVGARLLDFLHPEDVDEMASAMARAVDVDASGIQREARFLRPDGDVVWALLTVSVLRDDDGRPAWVLAHTQDVTARRRAGDARLRIALDAAGMGTWDWDLRTGHIRGSDAVAKMFGLDRMDDQRDVVMRHVHPQDAPRLDAAHRRVVAERGVLDEVFRVVLPDGQTRWVHSRAAVLTGPDGEPSVLVGVCQDRTQRQADEEERAALIGAQQRAADLAVRLQQLTAALAEAPTVERVAQTLAAAARELPGSPESRVTVLDPERGLRPADRASGGAGGRGPSAGAREAARGKAPVWLPTAEARAERYPGEPAGGAYVALPLVSHGRAAGAWEVTWGRARAFSAEEQRFLSTAASLAATTLERARLFDEQREVALLLQRSLLPDRLPRVPGVEVAARYVAAGGQDSQVGGDWYDVLPLADGRVGVVVGDVSGHGIPAASLMGQLRSTLRAYALEGRCPGEVLEAVNRALAGLGGIDPEKLVTVTYAILDPSRSRLRYARAGHPPLVLLPPDGEAVLLDEAGGLPLGVDLDATYDEGTAVVLPGARLVGYSDGLVERRDEALDSGVARLVAMVSASRDEPLDGLLDLLLHRLPAPDHDDDVTLVGVALEPAPMPPLMLRFPASYDQLPRLRERLTAWLAEAGAPAESAAALVLAASESVTNAIEDTPAGGSVDVHVAATVNGEQACVTVRHLGQVTGDRGIDRGRGLMLMEALAERLEVRHTADGCEVRICAALTASEPEASPGRTIRLG